LLQREAATAFLKFLLAPVDHGGRQGFGGLAWGPILGWAWLVGVEFEAKDGWAFPCFDYAAGQWHQIGEDALAGIEQLVAALGARPGTRPPILGPLLWTCLRLLSCLLFWLTRPSAAAALGAAVFAGMAKARPRDVENRSLLEAPRLLDTQGGCTVASCEQDGLVSERPAPARRPLLSAPRQAQFASLHLPSWRGLNGVTPFFEVADITWGPHAFAADPKHLAHTRSCPSSLAAPR
jgi:hypothetical protein